MRATANFYRVKSVKAASRIDETYQNCKAAAFNYSSFSRSVVSFNYHGGILRLSLKYSALVVIIKI